MPVSMVRKDGNRLKKRFSSPRDRRRRSDDLHHLLLYVIETTGIVAVLENEDPRVRPRAYEVGTVLSLRTAGRVLRLEPELFNPETQRRHFSEEQLEYLDGLMHDLPEAFAKARDNWLESIRTGLEEKSDE